MSPWIAIGIFKPTGNAYVDALPYLGFALIVLALFTLARKRRRKLGHAAAGGSARDEVERQRQQRGVRQDLESLMVEIEQLAKRMAAQLDAKSVQLERLLREADDRLARLERAADTPAAPHTPGAPPAIPAAPAQPAAAAGFSPPLDPLTRSVHELADQGLSSVDIARKLDEHVGKVELILALRKA